MRVANNASEVSNSNHHCSSLRSTQVFAGADEDGRAIGRGSYTEGSKEGVETGDGGEGGDIEMAPTVEQPLEEDENKEELE